MNKKYTKPHWVSWYKKQTWKNMRARILMEQPVCVYCARLGITKASDTVDHIKPHKGDPVAFWDDRNLQALCKLCHDSHKQRKEKSGILVGNDVDGWPVDPDSHWNR